MSQSVRRVKGLLADRNISLQQVADLAGEDIRTVSHVLKGSRKNRAHGVLRAVALATKIPLGYVLEIYHGENT